MAHNSSVKHLYHVVVIFVYRSLVTLDGVNALRLSWEPHLVYGPSSHSYHTSANFPIRELFL